MAYGEHICKERGIKYLPIRGSPTFDTEKIKKNRKPEQGGFMTAKLTPYRQTE